MKQIYALLLVFLLLSGCSASPKPHDQIIFYYPADSTLVAQQQLITEVPYAGNAKDTETILSAYFSGASDPSVSPFPAGVSVSSLKLKESHATLVLSDQFADLTGVHLTKACVCITKTICALTGVSTVTIGCQSKLIDGEQSITFSDNAVLWTDDGMTTAPTTTSTTPTK